MNQVVLEGHRRRPLQAGGQGANAARLHSVMSRRSAQIRVVVHSTVHVQYKLMWVFSFFY